MKLFKNTFKTIALLAIVLGCTNDTETSQDEELQALELLQEEIELLIAEGVCSENSDCDFIAFGSKPCGGPWSYLVYSTSIDVALLQQKVATYNNQQNAYNIKWGMFSDCSFATPPEEVDCVEGECVAIY